MSHLSALRALHQALSAEVIGQPELVDALLIALLTGEHLLLEGPPGLAKTTAVKGMADKVEGDFQRIQFTPDLMPADITGSEIYSAKDETFKFVPGPLFHHFILADEINRAPAKVQSALLEAMAEHQITVAGQHYPLAEPFMVLATQNPLEQEGTYPLPEAQLDRFLMKVRLHYPDAATEKAILRFVQAREAKSDAQVKREKAAEFHLNLAQLAALKKARQAVHCEPVLEDYLVRLVCATRAHPLIAFGASPRATLALDAAAKARALLEGRDYLLPEDIQALVLPVLRHRIILAYDALAKGLDADGVLMQLLSEVSVEVGA